MTTDRSKLRRLQQEVEMLQKYPSGEVAGILMWDLSQHVFCVQPEAVKQHIDLMEATLDHGGVDNSRELVEELQFPHWYESSGTWKYQLLRYLQRVDMDTLREDLHKFWQRCGHLKPPLELVTLAAKGPAKFYPVDDGEGGVEVFTDNASAHEYLHLEEGRRMLRCTSTMELGYDAIHAPGERRPPPPQPPAAAAAAAMARAYDAGAGPSGTGPSAREAPSERRETPTRGNLVRQVRSPTPDASSECSDWSTVEAASNPASTSLVADLTEGKSKNLKEAIGLAYEGVVSAGEGDLSASEVI
ncbi:hypothetical protein CYMTET_53625 [Cymbomonas tetramitiformis]|uniref:Uncharacterized protein n=1 Tax=Cymbomonas tetramitiformis TaxID=36881 RepID=A0AAE0BID2_9CHLO|nr:hypothetical protein CYMTET_53625 [Cymbomonas tetramitiformis]